MISSEGIIDKGVIVDSGAAVTLINLEAVDPRRIVEDWFLPLVTGQILTCTTSNLDMIVITVLGFRLSPRTRHTMQGRDAARFTTGGSS
jgi:hypothetical protein